MRAHLACAMARRLPALALLVAAPAAGAQQGALARRVAAAPADAAVAMTYPARPGVCGDGGSYVAIGGSTISGGAYFDGRELSRAPCVAGPVRVVLERRGRDVVDVRTTVGPVSARDGAGDAATID